MNHTCLHRCHRRDSRHWWKKRLAPKGAHEIPEYCVNSNVSVSNGGPGWSWLRLYDERRGIPRLALQVSLQCFPHAALLPPVEDRSYRLKVVQRDRITA